MKGDEKKKERKKRNGEKKEWRNGENSFYLSFATQEGNAAMLI